MQKKSDVVLISGTGFGKTLTFWIPMLYEPQSIMVLVTTLNVLGKQMMATLLHAGITVVNITAKNATNKIFQVSKFKRRELTKSHRWGACSSMVFSILSMEKLSIWSADAFRALKWNPRLGCVSCWTCFM
jgi:hypothetical protein